jgi:transmembrane sensor
MKKRIDWDLILNYLDGNVSDLEEKKLREWADENRRNSKELELLTRIWKSPASDLPKPDLEKAIQNVKEKMTKVSSLEAEQYSEVFKIDHKISRKPFFEFLISPGFLKAAVVIIIFAAGIFFISRWISTKPFREISVANKMIKNVVLSDGTWVKLDAGSTLKYSEKFEGDKRKVFLNGEGYFEVTPDKVRPFVVYTNSAQIKVVGTKFNVRAWQKNDKVVVTVVDGKVLFGKNNNNKEADNVTVLKGQISSMDEKGNISSPQYTDVSEHLSWMKREMHFQSKTIEEVLDQLNRWYDIKFSLPDESYKKHLITVFIQNKPINDILELISLMMNFKYEKSGNHVKFLLRE